MVIESASDRVMRILVVSVGIGSVVFTLLGLGQIVAQNARLDPAFAVAVYVLFLGLPPALALVAFRLPAFALRVALGAHAVLAIVFVTAWYRALRPASVPSDDRPWIFFTITVATCTAALAFPYLGAIAYALVAAVSCGILRFALYGGGDASAAVQDAVLIVLFSVVLTTLLQLALRSARLQDAALAAAQSDAAAAGSSETFARQRLRYQQFTRDEVLGVFAEVLRQGSRVSSETRQSASAALAKLAELQADRPTPSVLGAAEFESLLRSSIPDSVPLGITTVDPPGNRVLVPVDIADALADALGEAVRNSVQHADRPGGAPVLRRALVSITPRHVEITITDDGRGFTARRIAPDRLGVRVSILAGVNSLPGGTATVESSRGAGTTVTLDWRKDAVRA